MGYNGIIDLLSSDYGLDVVSDWKKDNPDKPVIGGTGSGSLVEQTTRQYNC